MCIRDRFTDVAYGEYDQVGTNLKSYDNKVNSIIKNIEDAMPKYVIRCV